MKWTTWKNGMEETKEKQSRCECLDFNMFANAGKDRVVRFVIATENLEGELWSLASMLAS